MAFHVLLDILQVIVVKCTAAIDFPYSGFPEGMLHKRKWAFCLSKNIKLKSVIGYKNKLISRLPDKISILHIQYLNSPLWWKRHTVEQLLSDSNL